MTEIAGVHGPAYGEILALVSDPDQRAIKANSEGGLVAYGEIPGTYPAGLIGDKTVLCRVTVPEAGYVKFWDVANMRLGMIPSGSGWKPYAYVISPEGDQTILGTELAEGSTQVEIAATYEQSTGTLTLYVDGVNDGDVSFSEARDTLAGLPIWQAGAAAGGYVTDCGLWENVLSFATNPTVTINQGSGQADPATASSIVFDIVFSEAVTGFSTGDVTLSGTASGTLIGTVVDSGDHIHFTCTVSGMTSHGTVIASIASSVCTATGSGLPNAASTSTDNTVTWAGPTLPLAIMALSPLGYWKLDDPSGTTATDSSGNGRHGTYAGSGYVLGGASGVPAGQGSFVDLGNAASSHISIADNNVWSWNTTPGLSIFALIKPDSSNPGAVQYLMSKGASSNFEWAALLFSNSTGYAAGALTLYGWSAAGLTRWRTSMSSAPIDTSWQAICLTSDSTATNEVVHHYRNSNTDISVDQGSSTNNNYVNGTAEVRIGWRADSPASNYFTGGMAHVAVFAGELNATQVGTLMSAADADGWF